MRNRFLKRATGILFRILVMRWVWGLSTQALAAYAETLGVARFDPERHGPVLAA